MGEICGFYSSVLAFTDPKSAYTFDPMKRNIVYVHKILRANNFNNTNNNRS